MVYFNFQGLMVMLAEGKSYSLGLTIMIIACVFTVAAAYLLGSVNSAIIISKHFYKKDIRDFGSGNAGMTNMQRTFGKRAAAYTLVGDIGKQFIAVAIGYTLLGLNGAYLAGTFCVLGHIFPVYYRFKGGKGVLTSAAMILCIDPVAFAVIITVFLIVAFLTRYISLSSIIAAFTYPSAVYYASIGRTGHGPHIFQLVFAVFIGCLVIYMHRSNIHRLFNNQEPKFSFRKKPEAQEIIDMEDKENDSDTTFYPPATDRKKKKKRK